MSKFINLLTKTRKVVLNFAGIAVGTAFICNSLFSIESSVGLMICSKHNLSQMIKASKEGCKKESKSEEVNTDSKPSEEK